MNQTRLRPPALRGPTTGKSWGVFTSRTQWEQGKSENRITPAHAGKPEWREQWII